MNTRVATNRIDMHKVIFISLAALCCSLFAAYVYLISASVVHVVIRTEVSQDITLISSQIGELESDFIEAQHRVSSDIASLQGYTPTASKVFIDRTPSSLVLGAQTVRE